MSQSSQYLGGAMSEPNETVESINEAMGNIDAVLESLNKIPDTTELVDEVRQLRERLTKVLFILLDKTKVRKTGE
jgi:hypothetical protein